MDESKYPFMHNIFKSSKIEEKTVKQSYNSVLNKRNSNFNKKCIIYYTKYCK